LAIALVACRGAARPGSGPPDATPDRAVLSDARAEQPGDARIDGADGDDGADAADVSEASAERASIGPFEAPFLPRRNVYYVAPKSARAPQRLLANLHGTCNPPGYACGLWVHTASTFGWLVCPEGNARCGPAMFDAPTWDESFAQMDADLERAVAKIEELHPGEISREGAILTGFSKGAYAAAWIVQAHPGRWPYLILTEADVTLDAQSLRKCGVRAVALIAGERGSQLPGERKTANQLAAQGYPAKLWVMPQAGHHYSANIEEIMREAIEYVLSQPEGDGGRDELFHRFPR
jgi:predicted esterase